MLNVLGILQSPGQKHLEVQHMYVGDRFHRHPDRAAIVMIQDTSERANALMQLRTKLGQLNRLATLIQQTFNDLDAVDLGKLKTPQLC